MVTVVEWTNKRGELTVDKLYSLLRKLKRRGHGSAFVMPSYDGGGCCEAESVRLINVWYTDDKWAVLIGDNET